MNINKYVSLKYLSNKLNNKDKVFEFFLLVVIFSVCLLWAIEEKLNVIYDYDRTGYMVTSVVILLCLGISFFLKKTNLVRVIVFCYLALYLLYLLWITFLQAVKTGEIYPIASTFQWIPILYIVSFLFLSIRRAIMSVVVIYGVVLILVILAHVNLAYLDVATLRAILLNASLSHAVTIFCLFGVLKLKRINNASNLYAQQMEKAANIDGLLGIGNRRMLQNELSLKSSKREPFSLLLIDVDYFKAINDTHGHLVGDDILRELTACIKDNLRPDDIIGRWGGEEFLVLAKGIELETTQILAERIRQAVESQGFSVVGKVTISIGVAPFKTDSASSHTFSQADKALYQAKHSGRNRVVITSD